MVKILGVSAHCLNPPEVLPGHGKIFSGPLSGLAKAKALALALALACSKDQLQAWSDKSRQGVRKWFDGDFARVDDLLGIFKTDPRRLVSGP